MKLLLCLKCNDIFNLDYHEKSCTCGDTKGKYNDKVNAEYSGKHAVPLGFDNLSIAHAINRQPKSGWGSRFTAFVIPKKCPTFTKTDQYVKTPQK